MEGYLSVSEKLRVEKTYLSCITLAMSSSAAIRGRVRDSETKKGLAGFTVSALRAIYFRGRRETRDGVTAFTDEQGDFRLGGLQPGDYLLEIKNFPQGTILPGGGAAELPTASAAARFGAEFHAGFGEGGFVICSQAEGDFARDLTSTADAGGTSRSDTIRPTAVSKV